MKEIRIKGWISRDKHSTKDPLESEVCLFAKKPELEGDGTFSKIATAWLERFLGVSLHQFRNRIKKGECKKVEIIIRELK